MTEPTNHARNRAHAKTPEDARFLARYDRWMQLPIVMAAVLPLMVSGSSGNEVGVIVGIASWLVFVLDFVVHMQRLDHYLGTWLGRFDLAIVVLTSPWYLLPGTNAGAFIVVLRLARVARVLVVAGGARRLLARLGRVFIVALLVVLVAAAVAFHAEQPVNPEFGSFSDALWWGYVTLTTVGYGDVVPVTDLGRWMGVAIMTTGIAVLGVLSGSLASFFRLTPKQADEDERDAERAREALGEEPAEPDDAPVSDVVDLTALTREMRELRAEIGQLRAHLGVGAVDPTGDRPPAPPTAAATGQ